MSTIVISYRRSDSQAIAGRIADRLIAQFGEAAVFMDVDSIPFGTDFRAHIQSVLAKAKVLVAVVGPDWLGVGAEGRLRIKEEDDPVRVEIETALRQGTTIVPVLVGGATMPKANALPDSLESFAFLNAAPVDAGRDFRQHAERLAQSIGKILAAKSGGLAASAVVPARARSRMVIAGSALLLLLAGAAAAWQLAYHSQQGGTSASLNLPSADDADWSKVKDGSDIAALRQFVEDHPGSKHRTEAELLLLGLLSRTSTSVATDEGAWTQAKTADTYDGYQAYLKAYPQGSHVTEATQAAAEVRPIANAMKEEPAMGKLLPGHTAIVDDRDPMCKRGEVKVVTGGDVTKVPIVYRTKKCVPRDQFP